MTTIIFATLAAIIAAASVFINVCLLIERKYDRADRDWFIKQGGQLEAKLDDAHQDNRLQQTKIESFVIRNRTLQQEVKSLKDILKNTNPSAYRNYQNKRKLNETNNIE